MKTVYVGLSGGVDSAVSAFLLKEKGYRVVGCFIKIWQPEFIECTWREDRLDAMRVAASLGIPFKEIDLSQVYQERVVEMMVREYTNGRTPNPDVTCNREVKFGAFSAWAFQDGADLVATGHYARIAQSPSGLQLLRGVDASKDQSYFLWQLTQRDLAKTLFPVGDLPKKDVRHIALQANLPVAQKPDSQGLCFVGDVTIPDFLERTTHMVPGSVLNSKGEVIGVHRGAVAYTIGQRHGFSVPDAHTPLYVVSRNIIANTITVSEQMLDAAQKSIVLEDVSWIERTTCPVPVQVQTRYREDAVNATVECMDTKVSVCFDRPHCAASGQSAVLYSDNRVLGGGIIA